MQRPCTRPDQRRRTGRALLGAGLSLALLGVGCGSDEGAQKGDEKPTHQAEGPHPNDDLPASEDAITTRRATRLFGKGVEAYKKAAQNGKDYAPARERFVEAGGADPAFGLARYNLAVLLEKEGNVAEASQKYREAFDLDPSLDPAVVNLGVLLEARGQKDEARALYEEAIVKNPEAVGPRIRLAWMARRDDDYRTAAKLAREALQFDAKSLEAYQLLARLYAEKKKNQLARLIALRGQKLNENDPELTYALAIVAMNDKDVAGARELLRQVIQTQPQHVDARLTLARLALENRDWKTAEPQLKALLEMEPKNADLHLSLGLALKGQGRFDEARQAYEAALAADETFMEAQYNLGILKLRHLDDPEGAIPHLEAWINDPGRETKRARKLLEEAELLVKAKAEEQRMLEEMRRMEEEAKRQAEAEAAEAAAAAKAEAEGTPAEGKGGAAEGQPAVEDGEQAAEASPAEPPPAEAQPAPEPKKVEPKKRKRTKKRRRRRSKPKPKPKPKPAAPEKDDDFFSD